MKLVCRCDVMIASRSCLQRYLRRRQRENTEHRERGDATPTSDDRDNFLSPTPAPTNAVMAEDDFEQVSAISNFKTLFSCITFTMLCMELTSYQVSGLEF